MKLLYAVPLILFAMCILWLMARRLGPNPRTDFHLPPESKMLEKISENKWLLLALAVGAAVVMSLVLWVMTLALNINLPVAIAYVILAVVAPFFITAFSLSFCRLWRSKPAKVVAFVAASASIVVWFFWPNWLTTDIAALVFLLGAMSSWLQVTLNFKIAAALVGGMFVYDIVNVYLTGNMIKLADAALHQGAPAPMLFIVPRSLHMDAGWAAALGTGDIMAPGFLILIASVLAYRTGRMSVLYGGLAGYAVGFALVEIILLIAHRGQPALLTLYPCVMAGILLAAWRAGLLRDLMKLRHEKPLVTSDGQEGEAAPA